jgi:uncharacterized damage-inducible protein DinB
MCEHDRASTRKLIGALEGREGVTREVCDKLAHVIAAQHLWMHRFGVMEEGPEEAFPTGWSLDRVAEYADQIGARWAAFADELDNARCDEVVAYTALEGTRHRNVLGDILIHLSMHGQYHRGQVARLMRDVIGEPVSMDYIIHVREDVEI